MTNIFVLIARRGIAALFPSVPVRDRLLIAAAMRDPYPSYEAPVPGCAWGSAWPGAGDDPEGGVAGSSTASSGNSRPGLPQVENLRNWRPAVEHRHLFADQPLAAMVDTWATEVDR